MNIPHFTPHPLIPDTARCVFQGVRTEIYQWDQEMFDGTVEVFERVRFFDGSFVIPILPDGRILITYQEQPARAPFYSFPGGGFDSPLEDPVECARRELLEETGYKADELVLWRRFEGTPSFAMFTYFYIGRGCYPIADISPDPGEKIELLAVTFDEFMNMVKNLQLVHHGALMGAFLGALLEKEKYEALRQEFFGEAG